MLRRSDETAADTPPPALPSALRAEYLTELSGIEAAQWNALLPSDYPFLRHEFLHGLERYDCLRRQNWQPCHVILRAGEQMIAAMPLYGKQDSYGEFVFDWNWAEAYQQLGLRYFPKLVSTVPFTPVQGPRLLCHPDYPREVLAALLVEAACRGAQDNRLSSVHCLFPDHADAAPRGAYALLQRRGCQYHWFNKGYQDFDDFLAGLRAAKRKKIKAERRSIRARRDLSIEVLQGKEISAWHWQWFHRFYCATFLRKWGAPRFTLDFLCHLGESLPDSSVLFFARKDRQPVAAALALRGAHTLYGRHWGCCEHIPMLHFELCYYQTIAYCIRKGLKCLDAGAQGEHKLSRGFVPVETRSWHWIRDARLRSIIAASLRRERRWMRAHHEHLAQTTAYRAPS